jgi:hypothetical protein
MQGDENGSCSTPTVVCSPRLHNQSVSCLQADAGKHCKKAKFEKGRVQQCLRRHRMVGHPDMAAPVRSLMRGRRCGLGDAPRCSAEVCRRIGLQCLLGINILWNTSIAGSGLGLSGAVVPAGHGECRRHPEVFAAVPAVPA